MKSRVTRDQNSASRGGGGILAAVHDEHISRRAFFDRPTLRMAPVGKDADMVEIFSGRNVAQREGRPDQPGRVAIDLVNPADEHITQAVLQQHGRQRGGGYRLEFFACFVGKCHPIPPQVGFYPVFSAIRAIRSVKSCQYL
jgi:hypothetical protein